MVSVKAIVLQSRINSMKLLIRGYNKPLWIRRSRVIKEASIICTHSEIAGVITASRYNKMRNGVEHKSIISSGSFARFIHIGRGRNNLTLIEKITDESVVLLTASRKN